MNPERRTVETPLPAAALAGVTDVTVAPATDQSDADVVPITASLNVTVICEASTAALVCVADSGMGASTAATAADVTASALPARSSIVEVAST